MTLINGLLSLKDVLTRLYKSLLHSKIVYMKYIALLSMVLIFSCSKDPGPTPPVKKPPEISDFTPKTGSVGDVITISGKNLTTATSVRFNGTDAFFKLSGGGISAEIPSGASSGNIVVANPDGSATSSTAFSVVDKAAPPTINAVLPDNNPVNWPVQINGANMGGITSIKFGDKVAPIDFDSTEIVTTRVPDGIQPGVVMLTLINANGTSNVVPFTIRANDPIGPPPPARIMIKQKARYIPVVNKFWLNERDNNYTLNLSAGVGAVGSLSNASDPTISYDVDILNFDVTNKTMDILVHYNTFGFDEVYKGTYVDSDVDNQDNPTRQRIIFYSEEGRQMVVFVDL
ncbi:MAG: hypothetical protein C5B52_03145 [Bacteroidetes bacterium]|nr:MAG: hypothetical protein C5B52_03145 [Bacteroidota bacterium]